MSKQGIDVSRWQRDINWAKVAQAKDFAIVRCTSGKSNALDSKFPANLKGCLAQNLPMGVYRYGYATTVAQAKAEAEAVVDAIRGYEMPCGVWYDAEDASQRKLSKSTLTAIIKAFHEVVEDAGFWVGIYCNQDWYDNVLDVGKFDCPFWVARYGTNNGKMQTKPEVDHQLYAWQYTGPPALCLAVYQQGEGLRHFRQRGPGRDLWLHRLRHGFQAQHRRHSPGG